MRILLVLPEFPPQYGGGIATYYVELVPALASHGHDVDVLVGSAFTGQRPRRDEDGYSVEFLDVERRQQASEEFAAYEAVPPLRRSLAAAWALFQQGGGGEDYDVVETTDFGLLFLPWVTSENSPPVLVQLHASNGQVDAHEPKKGEALQGHLTRLLEVQGLSCADGLQTYSQANARSWNKRLGREVRYCPPPLRSTPQSNIQAGPVNTEATGFVAGRIQYWKGPTVLCEAQAQFGEKAPRIDWAGRDTGYRAAGQSMSNYLADAYPTVWEQSIHPIGQIRPEEVKKRQQAARFVVVPSIWDVFNYTVVEAMREGTVTICSEGAGASDLIEDGQNGFTVPAEDDEALAGAIRKTLTLSPEGRKEIGDAGRETVRQTLAPGLIARRRIETYADVQECEGLNRDGTWLSEAIRPNGRFEVPSGRLSFLDQLPLRDIGRYLAQRVWEKVASYG
jgi:glycosyltransferase involved in cell wall biosynthesis